MAIDVEAIKRAGSILRRSGSVRGHSNRDSDENRIVDGKRPAIDQTLDRRQAAAIIPTAGIGPRTDQRENYCQRSDDGSIAHESSVIRAGACGLGEPEA